MTVPRGPIPDPASVDWQKAYRALVEACMTVPIKQHDRTPEQQAAVERYTTRLVQAGELLAGPELGMMDLPLEDGCSAREFLREAHRPEITDEMVERAAVAAFARDTMDGHHKGGPWTWERIPEQGRCNYRLTVRAALEAALWGQSDA